jgi:hypothetical protein
VLSSLSPEGLAAVLNDPLVITFVAVILALCIGAAILTRMRRRQDPDSSSTGLLAAAAPVASIYANDDEDDDDDDLPPMDRQRHPSAPSAGKAQFSRRLDDLPPAVALPAFDRERGIELE